MTSYEGDTLSVAERLLGTQIVRMIDGQRLSGIIVEVEAYLPVSDAASHSFRGPTRRNRSMFACPGTLYVYSIHAKHCLNVVTESKDVGAAVLIRAIQPVEGIELMQRHRSALAASASTHELGNGPAKLCQALNINLNHDGIDLVHSNEIWIEHASNTDSEIRWQISRTERIGISQATELPFRLFLDGHRCVSGPRKLHSSRTYWSF